MAVIGVDPGKTTGIFMVGGVVLHDQRQEWDAVDRIIMLMVNFDVDHVVMEAFNVFEKRTSLARKDIGWPLDIIGAVKYEAQVAGVPVSLRWNYQKNKVSDALLEERGWLAKPVHVMRHANDAARHVLGWSLKEGAK